MADSVCVFFAMKPSCYISQSANDIISHKAKPKASLGKKSNSIEDADSFTMSSPSIEAFIASVIFIRQDCTVQ